MKIYPLLSPEMEANLINESWQQLETNTQIEESDPTTLWEENFQDLSNWCAVDPQKINQFHIAAPPNFQKHQDYHTGEDIRSNNSGVKDNYDNLSHIKSQLRDITGITGNYNLAVDKNIISTVGGRGEMSFDGSPLPIGQEKLNTVTDVEDIWFDQTLLKTNDNSEIINEEHITNNSNDNTLLITNISKNEIDNIPTDIHSLDLISDTIENWFPIDTITADYDSNIISNNLLVTNIQSDDNIILDNYQSTSSNLDNNDKFEKKDILLTNDVGSDSFDLLSYVCDEGGVILDRENSDVNNENEKSMKFETEEAVKSSEIKNNNNNNNKSKSRREKKISKIREEIRPYVPPLKITIKKENLTIKKKRTTTTTTISSFKHQTDQEESVNYTDSDSDTTHTSDYNYKELREKNNTASRKSRINKKVKETEMLKRASNLERDNAVLKMKVEELEKLVTSMRTALLQSALKRGKT